MKKIIIFISGVLLLSSIIIVTFFGILPFSKEKNVYCDYIVLNMRNIMHDDKLVAEVLKRPDDSEIKAGDPWFDNDYTYRINVHDTQYLISSLAGKFTMHCEAKTYRIGKLVSDPKLNYYVYDPLKWTDYIKEESLTNDIIEVNNKSLYTHTVPLTIKVQSNDPKGKYINVRIQFAALMQGDQ